VFSTGLDNQLADTPMNGWNRLFVVVAVCWIVVAPFFVARGANDPVDQRFRSCSDIAYNRYGSSSSPQLNMDTYTAEEDRCLAVYARDVIVLPVVLGAMVGVGDRTLGLVAWGSIVIPLALLWIIGWIVGRLVSWVVAGFRQNPRR
jgi:hypothetical protein